MLVKKINADHTDQEVDFQGWIVHLRVSGKIAFLELRDGSGTIQCIVEEKIVGNEKFEEIKSCGIETSLSITGIISKHPKKDEFELQTKNFEIITKTKNYPIGQKEHGVDFLFDHRHLHLRSPRQIAIQKVRNTIIYATYDRMRDNDFTKIDAPIFTPTCAEDSSDLYEVEHTNGEKMFLSQSGQLYIEAAIQWHRQVFDFWPCFRAEKSKTRRHLNELWMMDAEMAFVGINGSINIQENLTYYIIQQVLKLNRKDLEIIGRDISKLELIKSKFLRKTHAEVVKELQEMGSDIKDWEDLGADDETMLMNKYDQPMFVTNYPKEIKAFYMPEDPEHPGTVKCADLLAPEGYGEVIGGSERLFDYDILKKKIIDNWYDLADYQRYLDLRKYGGVQSSGFGFWLERLVTWLCGLPHIRESIPFPRYANRITP